jgi:hypothetical protein
MQRILSQACQVAGFVGMIVGLFTTYLILKIAVVLYLVGFAIFLTLREE